MQFEENQCVVKRRFVLVNKNNAILLGRIVKMNAIAISPRSGFELQITTTLELKLSGCSARAI